MTETQDQTESPDQLGGGQEELTPRMTVATLSTQGSSRKRKTLSWGGIIILLTNIWLAAIAIYGLARFGSISTAVAYVRGDRLIPDASFKSFGVAPSGAQAKVIFTIRNYSEDQHKILGMQSRCTCLALDGALPAIIPGGNQFALVIGVRERLEQGPVNESFTLYTDDSSQPELVLRVSGRFYRP